jgi:dihydroorotate dehydrogenase electron transfer subunit
MAQQHLLTIADQRAVTPRLHWLTLHAPALARSVRAGQYLLVRCTPPGSYDPLLRRPLFVAAVEEALGQIGLLYAPEGNGGLAWLARGHGGDIVDTLGPFGHAFTLDRRTRNLLLVGQGAGLPALMLLAQQATTQTCAVTLVVGAGDEAMLPPPFLLPGEVEYESVIGSQIADFRLQGKQPASQSAIYNLQSAIQWADQICAALPDEQIPMLRDAVRAAKYRWERGFASVLREGPLVCGVGACGVCVVETRRGPRMLCSDGPVFDMRDVGRE